MALLGVHGYWRCTVPCSNNSLQNPLHTTTYLIIILKPMHCAKNFLSEDPIIIHLKEFKAFFFNKMLLNIN